MTHEEEFRDFNNHIVRDRTYAFDTLVEAGLVICHTQPDGTVGLEWPEPHHPAVAAYLAKLDDMQAGVRLAHPKTDPKGSRLKDIEDVRASVNDTLKSCQSDPPDTTVGKPATSKARFRTIEAVRACTADVLNGFDIPLTRYELGFQMGFEELGRMLNPAGYHRGRSRSELIAGLKEPPTKTSTARLPTVEAVREHLDAVFADNEKLPSDNRYLYGYEDANWFLWSYVDPMGFEAAQGYLPR